MIIELDARIYVSRLTHFNLVVSVRVSKGIVYMEGTFNNTMKL